MATGSLDGFPGVLPDGSGSYSPSPDIADAALAAALAREYFSLTVKDDLGCNLTSFTRQVEAIRPLIGKGVNGQPLLDDLVEMIFTDGTDEERTHCGGFLTAVVQALYDAGRDDLTLDLTAWQASPPFVGWFLHGTPERRLGFTYRGGAGQFGGEAAYCDVVVEGNSTVCGKYSTNVSFAVHGSVHQLGEGCADSLFAVSGKVIRVGSMATNSEFYLDEEPLWDVPYSLMTFLQMGNVLYLPGDDGSKKKICLATHLAGVFGLTSS